jgi:hypothetical protein
LISRIQHYRGPARLADVGEIQIRPYAVHPHDVDFDVWVAAAQRMHAQIPKVWLNATKGQRGEDPAGVPGSRPKGLTHQHDRFRRSGTRRRVTASATFRRLASSGSGGSAAIAFALWVVP